MFSVEPPTLIVHQPYGVGHCEAGHLSEVTGAGMPTTANGIIRLSDRRRLRQDGQRLCQRSSQGESAGLKADSLLSNGARYRVLAEAGICSRAPVGDDVPADHREGAQKERRSSTLVLIRSRRQATTSARKPGSGVPSRSQ